jgi:ferredoxin
MDKISIEIDYNICGNGNEVDPRECGICLRVCDPALFLLHQPLEYEQDDPLDPQVWKVTPLYPSLCTLCMKCVNKCPEEAITIIY